MVHPDDQEYMHVVGPQKLLSRHKMHVVLIKKLSVLHTFSVDPKLDTKKSQYLKNDKKKK